jgi:hypothetical protein
MAGTLTKHQRAQWRRLWRRIHERTTISEPAAKHAALIAIEFVERSASAKHDYCAALAYSDRT